MKNLSVMVLALLFAVSSFAQEKFVIAGGGGAKNGSVYSNMVGTIAQFCSSDQMTIEEQQTSGGVENLSLIRNNKVKAAIVPSDVLAAAKFDNAASVAQIWTLMTLHNEAAHLIVRGDAKKEGGFSIGKMQIGGETVVFNNPEDLKGRVIGAVGGSAITGRIISDMLRYSWKIDSTSFKNTSELLAALTSGKIDAVIISAGLQSDAVKSIKGNFKLLPLRGNSDTQAVYQPMKIEYTNLNGGRSVDTIGARAVLVTRTWRSEEMLQTLGTFRHCMLSNLGKIQDTTDTHPAWQDVNAEERGTWQWYNLPNPASKTSVKKKN